MIGEYYQMEPADGKIKWIFIVHIYTMHKIETQLNFDTSVQEATFKIKKQQQPTNKRKT